MHEGKVWGRGHTGDPDIAGRADGDGRPAVFAGSTETEVVPLAAGVENLDERICGSAARAPRRLPASETAGHHAGDVGVRTGEGDACSDAVADQVRGVDERGAVRNQLGGEAPAARGLKHVDSERGRVGLAGHRGIALSVDGNAVPDSRAPKTKRVRHRGAIRRE